jgi:hypothetical protein
VESNYQDEIKEEVLVATYRDLLLLTAPEIAPKRLMHGK